MVHNRKKSFVIITVLQSRHNSTKAYWAMCLACLRKYSISIWFHVGWQNNGRRLRKYWQLRFNLIPASKRHAKVYFNVIWRMHKAILISVTEYISSMLTYVSQHHDRHTKSTVLDLLRIPRSHSAYFDRAFSVQGPKLWNSLPVDIRNSTSINRFKHELKCYLLYNN